MNNFNPTELQLQNYIQNKLSDTETEQLELWLADNPEVMEDLEMGEMFKQGIVDSKAYVKSSKRDWLTHLFQKPVLIFSHVAMLAIGMFLFNAFINKTSSNSMATFIELEKQRGSDTSVIEVNTNKSKSLVLRFFPDSMTENYSLTLNSKTSEKKIEFKNLQADDFGSITVTLNDSENMQGKWEVLLRTHTLNNEQIYLLIISNSNDGENEK